MKPLMAGSQTAAHASYAAPASARTSVGVSCLDHLPHAKQIQAELRGENFAQGQPAWLTDVVSTVVHSERGQAKKIALDLGVRESAVYEVADPNNPRPLKAWYIPAICRETGSIAVLEAIAQQVGCAVFKLPVVTNPVHADVIAHTGVMVQEFGDVLAGLGSSLADGRVTVAEREHVQQEIRDVQAQLASLSVLIAHISEAV